MTYIYNNKPITRNGIVLDDVWYSLDYVLGLSDEERTDLGITKQAEPTPQPLTLEQLKENKLNEINGAFEQTMQQVRAGYPNDEVMSWSKQESDARAYLADNTVDAKLLESLADVRQVPKDIFAKLIINKADQYAVVVGQLVGKRQLLEGVIENATIDTIDSISW
jgi:hypothetical protein